MSGAEGLAPTGGSLARRGSTQAGLTQLKKVFTPTARDRQKNTATAHKRSEPGAVAAGEAPPTGVLPHKLFRLAVLGLRGVGKTCIIERFVDGAFNSNTIPTIEDTYEVQMQLEGVQLCLHILDTPGEEVTSGMTMSYIRRADGFVLVYSVDTEASFVHVTQLVADIHRHRYAEIPIVVLGNKADDETTRVVSEDRAQQFCQAHQLRHVVVSAKQQTNMAAPFVILCRHLLSAPPPKKRKEKERMDDEARQAH